METTIMTQSKHIRPATTKYKHIHFIETSELCDNKTVWDCKNNKSQDILAKIFYYTPWKQYCFTQYSQNVVFNDGCLTDIVDFLKQLNGE